MVRGEMPRRGRSSAHLKHAPSALPRANASGTEPALQMRVKKHIANVLGSLAFLLIMAVTVILWRWIFLGVARLLGSR